MRLKTLCVGVLLLFTSVEAGRACNQTTYAGCSPEELRAIQQQQFNARKRQPVSVDDYWRERQYADRLRLEQRNHELEIEKIRSQTAVEVARQERRSWAGGGYYFYRPPVIVHPRPSAPVVVVPGHRPEPRVKETVTSEPIYRRVPRATAQ